MVRITLKNLLNQRGIRVIGISGKKQSGKDTLAASFCDTMQLYKPDHNCFVLHFADPLKFFIQTFFGASNDQLDGTDKDKNTKLPCGFTCREVMQWAGDFLRNTDMRAMLRPMHLNLIKMFSGPAGIGCGMILIPDVRFLQEVDFIRDELGGVVVRLTRQPYPKDHHNTEVGLDRYDKFDHVIDNAELVPEDTNRALWNYLKRIDYV